MENEILKTLEGLSAGRNFAVGNDLVFVPDFKQSLTDLFKKKVYTEAEIEYCDSFADSDLRYASTWAAKEAIYKAVKQLDQTALGWKNLEILRERTAGQPHVIIHKDSQKYQVSLSISHDGDYAWAIVFITLNP